jgi:hypothetical protein
LSVPVILLFERAQLAKALHHESKTPAP